VLDESAEGLGEEVGLGGEEEGPVGPTSMASRPASATGGIRTKRARSRSLVWTTKPASERRSPPLSQTPRVSLQMGPFSCSKENQMVPRGPRTTASRPRSGTMGMMPSRAVNWRFVRTM